LLIRAAWVEAKRGNLAQAIAQAQAALAEHPNHYGGWRLLSDWHLQNNDAAAAVQAAEKMAALAPQDPVPLVYLGDLKLRLQDRKGAKIAFESAFAMDPDYEYAGVQLFHLHVSDGALADAEQTLAVLRRRRENHRTIACAVHLAVASQEIEQALELFKQLSADPEAEEWSLKEAAAPLDHAGCRQRVDAAVYEALSRANISPGLAATWVARQTAMGQWNLHAPLARFPAGSEVIRCAVLCYLDALGEAFQANAQQRNVTTRLRLRFHFGRLMEKHRTWLRSNMEGWGKVGYVLTSIGRPGPVIEWLGDWKERPQAESWMLYNLVLMLQRTARYAEARDVICHAVGLRHGVDLYEVFRLWAAFEEALIGNIALAQQHLATLQTQSVREARRPVQVMTQLLISLRCSPAQDKSTLLRSIRTSVRSAFGRLHPYEADHYARKAYLRFLRVAVAQLGGPALWLWGRWYYRGWAWLWLPAIVVLALGSVSVPPLAFALWMVWRRFRRS
jgi:tetratricopeptide (TPR) repeat protein